MTIDNILQGYINTLKSFVLNDSKISGAGVTRKEMYTYLYTKCVEQGTFVPAEYREKVISSLLNSWYTYDVLQGAMDDPYVSDVHVIGTTTIVKRNGSNYESTESRFPSEDALMEFIARKLENTPYAYSLAYPITDAILPDGSRVNIIGGPSTRYTVRDEDERIITEPRTIVTIRKPIYPFSMDDLIRLQMLDEETRAFFKLMMQLGDSFIIAGGVGSGKTTLMNALTGDIPKGLLSIFVEELPEMTPLTDWCIRLTDRSQNVEGKGRLDMATNIINTLRMDNDNGYIGEVRTAQIAHLFLRMSLLVKRQTGTTFHSHIGHKNNVEGVLTRFILEATEGAGAQASYLNTASRMADKIRHIVTTRDTKHGKRVTEIGEIIGFDFTERALLWQPVLTYDFFKDKFCFHGVTEGMVDRARVEGIDVTLPLNCQPIRKYKFAS